MTKQVEEPKIDKIEIKQEETVEKAPETVAPPEAPKPESETTTEKDAEKPPEAKIDSAEKKEPEKKIDYDNIIMFDEDDEVIIFTSILI